MNTHLTEVLQKSTHHLVILLHHFISATERDIFFQNWKNIKLGAVITFASILGRILLWGEFGNDINCLMRLTCKIETCGYNLSLGNSIPVVDIKWYHFEVLSQQKLTISLCSKCCYVVSFSYMVSFHECTILNTRREWMLEIISSHASDIEYNNSRPRFRYPL